MRREVDKRKGGGISHSFALFLRMAVKKASLLLPSFLISSSDRMKWTERRIEEKGRKNREGPN